MLKLLTLILWVGPALLLFVYLLWISKGPPRLSDSDGQPEAPSQQPFVGESRSTTDNRLADVSAAKRR